MLLCEGGEKCSHGGALNSIRRHINTPAPPLLITCLICSKWDGWIGFGDEIAALRVVVLQKWPRPAGTGLVTTSINMKPETTNSPRWDPESSSRDRRVAVCVNRCFAAAYFLFFWGASDTLTTTGWPDFRGFNRRRASTSQDWAEAPVLWVWAQVSTGGVFMKSHTHTGLQNNISNVWSLLLPSCPVTSAPRVGLWPHTLK